MHFRRYLIRDLLSQREGATAVLAAHDRRAAFPDRLGEAWWLGLEEVIARENRLSLVMDRKERHFNIGSTSEKYQLYDFLEGWMRSLPPSDLSSAINDLCKRYSVDLAALSREASMEWGDLAKLAGGAATAKHCKLSIPRLAPFSYRARGSSNLKRWMKPNGRPGTLS